jgi:hypothetical protein
MDAWENVGEKRAGVCGQTWAQLGKSVDRIYDICWRYLLVRWITQTEPASGGRAGQAAEQLSAPHKVHNTSACT